LGFALLGVSDRPACRGLRRDSSFVLNGSADGGHPSRMHLRVSITERLPRPVAGSGPLLGFSHLSVSRCSNQRQPGLCVHLTGRPPLLVARAGSLGCRDSTGATWSCIPGLTICSCNPWPSCSAFYGRTFRLSFCSRLSAGLSGTKCPSGSGVHFPKDM
jgi:hypothetical protein